MSDLVKFDDIQERIIEIRSQKMLLDADVAELYGVETKRINEAVKNNPDKFPAGYIIELDKGEWELLKSKFSTSTKGGKVKRPSAFSEKGLYMLATILKSPKAVQATLAIIEAFAKVRQLSRSIRDLATVQDKTTQKALMEKMRRTDRRYFRGRFSNERHGDFHRAKLCGSEVQTYNQEEAEMSTILRRRTAGYRPAAFRRAERDRPS